MTEPRPDDHPEVEARLPRTLFELSTAAERSLDATSTLQREHERALREITSALAQHLDERYVLELAVRYSAQLFRAPYARIWLLDRNGELSCAAAEGYVHSETFSRRLSSESTSGRA